MHAGQRNGITPLNSDHVAETGREDVNQAVIGRLLPIVDAQEGDLPEVGLAVDIMTPLDDQRRRLPGADRSSPPASACQRRPT